MRNVFYMSHVQYIPHFQTPSTYIVCANTEHDIVVLIDFEDEDARVDRRLYQHHMRHWEDSRVSRRERKAARQEKRIKIKYHNCMRLHLDDNYMCERIK